MAQRLKTAVLRGLAVACAAAMLSLSGAATAQEGKSETKAALEAKAEEKAAPRAAVAPDAAPDNAALGGGVTEAQSARPPAPPVQDDVDGGGASLAALALSVLALLGTIGVLLMHLNFKKKVAVLLEGAQDAPAASRATSPTPAPQPRPTAAGRSRPLVSDSTTPSVSRYNDPDPMPAQSADSIAQGSVYDRRNDPVALPEDGPENTLDSRVVGGDPSMFDRARAGDGYAPQSAVPVLSPVPQAAPPAPAAPAGPRLLLSLPALQSLVERGADMAASEFRAEANRLGQWREADIGAQGAVLHTGEDDGQHRPMIAIVQSDSSVAIIPSASFARDFPHQNYKIGNAAAMAPYFDLQIGGSDALRLIQPCLARVEGANIIVLQRGALTGFSD